MLRTVLASLLLATVAYGECPPPDVPACSEFAPESAYTCGKIVNPNCDTWLTVIHPATGHVELHFDVTEPFVEHSHAVAQDSFIPDSVYTSGTSNYAHENGTLYLLYDEPQTVGSIEYDMDPGWATAARLGVPIGPDPGYTYLPQPMVERADAFSWVAWEEVPAIGQFGLVILTGLLWISAAYWFTRLPYR
ncbi:MAG: hypothetical protein V3T08_02355 [Gemmatimonadota bacterium]